MRGIHFVLATMLVLTLSPLVEASSDRTIPLSNVCTRAPERGLNLDRFDAVLPDSLERTGEHFENLNFWCDGHVHDIEI